MSDLHPNETQFAILQGLFGVYAWTGSGPLAKEGRQENLRAVTMLWQNVEHFVIKSAHARKGTVADLGGLKGKSAGFGKRNSGTIGSNRRILANLGMDLDKEFHLFYGGYGASASALQDGKVEVISTPAGVPVGALTKVFAALGEDITLLNFTPAQAKQADGGLHLWTPYRIPAGTYPGQGADVNTIAQPNFLAVRADVPEDDVYRITRTVFENLGFLQAIHKATNAMAPEKAIVGLPMPLHPGAARYYREIGLDIPGRLTAN